MEQSPTKFPGGFCSAEVLFNIRNQNSKSNPMSYSRISKMHSLQRKSEDLFNTVGAVPLLSDLTQPVLIICIYIMSVYQGGS